MEQIAFYSEIWGKKKKTKPNQQPKNPNIKKILKPSMESMSTITANF